MIWTLFMSLTGLLWLAALGLAVAGTVLALRKMRATPPYLDAPFRLYPVSILKPLKGVDPGLEANLETFFRLDYPEYELIFSIAEANDPAGPVAQRLMERYPQIPSRLIVGGVDVGPNPKVNNLVRSYETALHDLLLISDSNIRVGTKYLRRMVGHLDSGVGMITAVVAGRDPRNLGSLLESVFLNTFYARWMVLSEAFGHPCVVGKSMLFRRSVSERFGGMRALGRYLAEDYMAGEAVRKLGLEVIVMTDPVDQYLGASSLDTFWSRHLRWGRIRKSQAPLPFAFELFSGMFMSGFLGAFAVSEILGFGAFEVFVLHLAIWSTSDFLLASRLESGLGGKLIVGWFLREALAVPLWLHTLFGNSVQWRGRSLRLAPGGLLASEQP